YGANETFQATVTKASNSSVSPTDGTVAFSATINNVTTQLGSTSVNSGGIWTLTLPATDAKYQGVGSYIINATYTPGANSTAFIGSSTNNSVANFTVSKAPTIIKNVSLVSPANPVYLQ